MTFTDLEKDMARRGYVYLADSGRETGFRKQVRSLDGRSRDALIFDVPAYECHRNRRIGGFK
jgi:hypothetical protein